MKALNSLVMGVDGGGSGCRVAMSDGKGQIIAQAQGGPANVTSDFAGAVANLRATIDEVLALAPVGDPQKVTAHMGVAGVIEGTDSAGLFDEFTFGHLTISDDRLTSTVGALGSRNGILVSVGTGSFVACQRDNAFRYLGGWGLQIGDQASGAWLGKKLLERCVLVSDGLLEPSDLTEATLKKFSHQPASITAFAATAQPSDYAAYAPDIVAAADVGDAHACALLQKGGTYLQACVDHFALSDQDVLCLGGSLGPRYAAWLAPEAQTRIVDPLGTALDGALTLARRAAEVRH